MIFSPKARISSVKIFNFSEDFFNFIIVLHHSASNNQAEVGYDYLRKLYDFGVFLGKFNKPLVLSLKGEIGKIISLFLIFYLFNES